MATLRLGDDAPDFTAETTEGRLSFHEWKGDGRAVLFSHPAGGALCIAATPAVLNATGLADRKWARNLLHGYPLAAPLQMALALVALAGVVRWWRASRRATVAA